MGARDQFKALGPPEIMAILAKCESKWEDSVPIRIGTENWPEQEFDSWQNARLQFAGPHGSTEPLKYLPSVEDQA